MAARRRIFDGAAEAKLIALMCSPPPKGRAKWSLRLLEQLVAETRVPMPAKAGRPMRHDYEYERNGTANLFMMFAPLEGWRHVKSLPPRKRG